MRPLQELLDIDIHSYKHLSPDLNPDVYFRMIHVGTQSAAEQTKYSDDAISMVN